MPPLEECLRYTFQSTKVAGERCTLLAEPSRPAFLQAVAGDHDRVSFILKFPFDRMGWCKIVRFARGGFVLPNDNLQIRELTNSTNLTLAVCA
jgi:hypothetical protein